jgi:Mrp family chromosome partitioning ATPase/capsular polysaccharide biosynthesis protein
VAATDDGRPHPAGPSGSEMTTTNETDGLSLRAYLRVVARWKWVVIAIVVLVTALGTAYSWSKTPLYSATSKLLYVSQLDIANPLGQSYIDSTAQQAEIESVPTVIGSADVRKTADDFIDPATVDAGYSVSASLEPGLSNNYSNVVAINGVSPDAEAAADAANSYAKAFIEWSRDSARSQVSDAISVVEERIATFTTDSQRQSSEYQSLQQSLQDLQLLEASTTGNFKIITPASPPGAPFEPRRTRGLALSLIVGLILGIGTAFVLEQFDTRVRGEAQVLDQLDLPVLAHVPPLTRRDRAGSVIQMLNDPSGAAAESYRLLRSNLEFTAVDSALNTLLVSSSVQGEGKSVISCNLAVSFALAGKRVVLVDADLRGPRVHAYMGIPNAKGVSTLVARRDTLDDVLVPVSLSASPMHNGSIVMTAQAGGKVTRTAGPEPALARPPAANGGWLWPDSQGGVPVLRVLPSGPIPPNPGEIVASRRFADLLAELAKDADLVIVDAPAMLPVGDTAALAPHVDSLVYVANPTLLKRQNLEQAHSQLAHLPCPILGLIVVADRRGHGYYGYYSREAGQTPKLGRARA